MLRRGNYTLLKGCRVVLAMKVVEQFFPVELTIEFIDLRNFLAQFVNVSFRQATHYIHGFEQTFFFLLAKLQNHIDTFFLCICNEAASIDYCNVAVRVIGIVIHFKAMFLELVKQLL